MADAPERSQPTPLTRWEVIGAWLHLWTPPRDATVPPVPWRRIGLGATALALLLTAAGLAIVPAVDRGKKSTRDRERRETAVREAAKARQLRREGRRRTGSAVPPANEQKLSAGRRRAARRELVLTLEASIAADARTRVRHGRLKGPIRGVRCTIEPPSQRFIERDLSRRAAPYDCLVITRRDPDGRFLVGHPFRARVDYRRFTYSWRKVCLPPGEGALRLAC